MGEDVGGGEGEEAGATASGGATAGWSHPPSVPVPQYGLPSVPGAEDATGLPSVSSSSPTPPASAPQSYNQPFTQPQVCTHINVIK